MKLHGICPIIAAPFTDEGEVDYDSLQNLVRVLTKNGCGGVTLFGIAGEYYKLTGEEMQKMVSVTVAECRRQNVPSVISVTQHATEVAVNQARIYEEAGADCLMVLPPFFLKPGSEEICRHLQTVAKAVKIPVMVQYAPEQTGVSISPSALAELREEAENIRYYKIECKPAGGYLTKLLKSVEGKADVFIGNAGYQFIEGFDRGAVGVMPGCSMFDVYLKIYRAYCGGNRDEAGRICDTVVLPMLNHIRQNVEMIIAFEKKILKKRGIIASDYCRRPTFAGDAYYDRLFEEHYQRILPYFEDLSREPS